MLTEGTELEIRHQEGSAVSSAKDCFLLSNSLYCRANATSGCSPFGKARSSSDGQDITRNLYQQKVHCRIHKSPSPVPVLSRSIHFMVPHHTLILSSHLRLDFPSGLFPSGVQNKTLRELLYSIRAT